MTQQLINQLWQAIKEAKTPYDYAIIFNYSNDVKGDMTNEGKNS
ncbi:hypothetical protein [Anaerobacillus alkalilacustris]|nr:hypothetical protein [Anaerobacillus alkalilacustris]